MLRLVDKSRQFAKSPIEVVFRIFYRSVCYYVPGQNYLLTVRWPGLFCITVTVSAKGSLGNYFMTNIDLLLIDTLIHVPSNMYFIANCYKIVVFQCWNKSIIK